MKFDLWSGFRIPILMVSGSVNSGKTLLGLTIDPNCRKQGVKPTTIHWDQEGSSDSYEGALTFVHKDTRAAVASGVHMNKVAAGPQDPRWLKILKENADCNDSPSASLFRAWYLSLLNVPAGEYAVGICDTFTPLQDGLVDWLKRHPEAFGRTFAEYQKASSMFLWPDVKSVLSHILAIDCRLRFETFVISVHLKNEWTGGAKTGQKVAEGLDVLEKLATVHLQLDRSPHAKGKEAPRVPSAIVKKERLVRFGMAGDEDKPVLPPHLKKATPEEIRRYITNPPDFDKLSADERLPDQSLTDDQKILIAQATAQQQAEAAQAHLSALELARMAAAGQMLAIQQANIAAQQQPQVSSLPVQQPPIQPHTIQQSSPATEQPAVQTQEQPAPAMMTPAQLQTFVKLIDELFASRAIAKDWCRSKHGVDDLTKVTELQAEGILADLHGMMAAKRLEAANANLAANQPAAVQPPQDQPPVNVEQAQTDGMVTDAQRALIQSLTGQLFKDDAMTAQSSWLKSLGIGAARSLKYSQAAERIVWLQEQLQPKPVVPEGEIPF